MIAIQIADVQTVAAINDLATRLHTSVEDAIAIAVREKIDRDQGRKQETEALARLGRQAYRRSGKGSGHRARRNFGDCFAYALAVEMDEPLLFKGNDFVHTDVKIALPSDR